MSLVFEPRHEFGGERLADCRLSLTQHYPNKTSGQCKNMGLDFRINEQSVRDWGIRDGDRIVARRDDDGTWWMRIVLPTERGYVVRIGGTKKHNGRKKCAYFRISVTEEIANTLFPDGNRVIELDIAGVEQREACFMPARKRVGLQFCPAS